MVQRNIEVEREIWSKLKAESVKQNRNIRELAGDIISDYVSEAGGKERKVKAIIIAAGPGSRLKNLTKNSPKCMLKINGKTILQKQLDVYRACGIKDIAVIRGYKKNLINYPGLRYYNNLNYMNNNINESMFTAEKEMDSEFIVSYSDIVFEENVVRKLMRSNKDISVVVDTDWLKHYVRRDDHPVEEAENAIVEEGKVIRIGKVINQNEATGEFIGMAKFSELGAKILKNAYNTAKKNYGTKPFHAAKSMQTAYLTDMIQELIENDYDVHSVDIEGGWVEIDTLQDFEKAGGKVPKGIVR